MNKKILAAFLLFAVMCGYSAAKSTVIRHPEPTQKLSDKYQWALKQIGAKLIVWSFDKEMQEREFIGSFYSETSRYPSLRMILSDVKDAGHAQNLADETRKALQGIERRQSHATVMREVGILMDISAENKLRGAEVSMLDMQYNPKSNQFVWLGKVPVEESLNLAQQLYAQNKEPKTREEMIPAIALHGVPSVTVPFMEKVLIEEKDDDLRGAAGFWLAQTGDAAGLQKLMALLPMERSDEVIDNTLAGMNDLPDALDYYRQLAVHGNPRRLREQAIFWIGQTEEPEAAKILKETIQTDADLEMKKKAIFSLSQMPESMSLDFMIGIAQTEKSEEVRKEAVFWLSQIASERVARVLKETAQNDSSVEVQKQAIFALSEVDDDEAVTELIRIAKTHPNIKLRKEAIFWLGESDDPRAREALFEMLKN